MTKRQFPSRPIPRQSMQSIPSGCGPLISKTPSWRWARVKSSARFRMESGIANWSMAEKRNTPVACNITSNFLQAINSTRERVVADVILALANTDKILDGDLHDTIFACYEGMKQLRYDRDVLFFPTQPLVQMLGPQLATGTYEKEFLGQLSHEEHFMNQLWAEWGKIQQKIACLGVEVLGGESSVTAGFRWHRYSKKNISRAIAIFNTQAGVHEEMSTAIRKQGHGINATMVNTLGTLRTQQKQRKSDKQQQREQVRQLVKTLATHVEV